MCTVCPGLPSDPAAGPLTDLALVEDGSLVLRAEAGVLPDLARWLPRVPAAAVDPSRVRARIHVRRGAADAEAPPGAPFVQLLSVGGWGMEGGRIRLATPAGEVCAVVDPDGGTADVRLAEADASRDAFQAVVSAALTLAAAFLLGRLERTLVHAAAIVAPDGRAWLLPAGTFSGKTSTVVSLVRHGWDFVSDDHVVLGRDRAAIRVEGWLRKFNLDLGYERRESRGVRRRVEPEGFGPGRWRRAAPLAGLLLPRVEAALPTELTPATAADALSAVLPQSPWLMADPATAPAVLALLRQAAEMPAFRLRLGADSYGDGAALAGILARAVRGEG